MENIQNMEIIYEYDENERKLIQDEFKRTEGKQCNALSYSCKMLN